LGGQNIKVEDRLAEGIHRSVLRRSNMIGRSSLCTTKKMRRICRTTKRSNHQVNKTAHSIRLQRRTPNPFNHITDNYKKYGKYSYLFDEVEDPLRKYDDKLDKHQKHVMDTYWADRKAPLYSENTTWVAPSSTLSGVVMVGNYSSVWYGCVLRADTKLIRIGLYTNIQDNTIIHDNIKPINYDHDGSTIIGSNVTIGHSCRIRAATIEPYCLVGSQSVLMEGAYMESGSHLGAGSVLFPDQRIPQGQLWAGSPAKFVRQLTDDEIDATRELADYYWRLASRHQEEFYPNELLHYEAQKQGVEIGVQGVHKERPWGLV